MFRLCARRIGAETARIGTKYRSISLSSDQVKAALRMEIDAVQVHSSLLNQAALPGLLELADVRPMMQHYQKISASGAAQQVLRPVTRALNRTARDSSVAMRKMLRDQRTKARTKLFAEVKQACDIVAIDLKLLASDLRSAGYLLSTYELVAPQAGVDLFYKLKERRLAASAIMCMVAAKTPLDQIESVFLSAPPPVDPRRTANMIFAYQRAGDIAKAEALVTTLGKDTPENILRFIEEGFIGYTTAATAVRHFNKWSLPGAPHPAAMSRLLERVQLVAPSADTQIGLFARYVELATKSRHPAEHDLLQVTRTVVANVISGHKSPHTALPDIEALAATYGALPKHAVFLNILLTSVSSRWESAASTSLVQMLLKSYGPTNQQGRDTLRVQLNALEFVPDKESQVAERWALLADDASKFDWFALLRASNGTSIFSEEWDKKGRPFEAELARYARSRQLSLE